MARQQSDFADRLHGALRLDVEPADRFDLVVKQVKSEGLVGAHRKYVDDAAANRKFASGEHLLDVGVACGRQIGAKAVDGKLVAQSKEEGVCAHVGDGRHALGGRDGRGNDNVEPLGARCHAVERLEALGDDVLLGREHVVGERFPVRKASDAERRAEPGNFLSKPHGVEGICADDEKLFIPGAAFFAHLGERERIRCGGSYGERVLVAGPESEDVFGNQVGDCAFGHEWTPWVSNRQ